MADDHNLPLIEPTGERFARTASEAEVELEHVHRYRVAGSACAGKRVLDAASGEGYGTAMLAAAGADVVGVEIDAETVAAARLRYPGVEFVEGDVGKLPFPDHHFDVITSFETLEHIPEPQTCLEEFRRVLKPGGVLIISTPDKTIYNQHLAEPNPYHLHEMEREEFRRNLLQRFKNIALYGQRVVFGSLLVSASGGRLDTTRRIADGSIVARDSFDGAMYLVAVCSDGPLPSLSQGVYEGGIPQNALSSLLGGIEERDRDLRTLRESAASAPGKVAAAAAAALARDAEAATAALAQVRADADERARESRGRLAAAQAEVERIEGEHNRLLQTATETTEALTALSADHADLANKLQAETTQAKESRREADSYRRQMDAQARSVAVLHAELLDRRPVGIMAYVRTWLGDVLLAVRRYRRSPRFIVRAYLSLRAIRSSGLLLESYYRRGRRDLNGVDAVRHYFLFGVTEGRDPSQLFSNEAYLRNHPEVEAAGYNPLAHFVRFGRAHGWSATPSLPLAAAISRHGLAASRPASAAPAPVTAVAPRAASRPAHAAPPSKGRAAWVVADDPLVALESLNQYDVRPDDDVPREARRGAEFLAEHRLLTGRPDYPGAVDALNARPARALADDASAAPEASIIVPAHGQLAYTLNCLDALLAHESRHSFEVILVDDASPDASGEHLPNVAGIRYQRQAENGGFIASSNAGAHAARGAVLVMLNNDTRVVAGWLDELMATFSATSRAGLAGSKLFYPDGALQEAGGILWRDGSAWNYGRNEDPNRPEYCYARRVDYVSGASIAVPADLWRSLGGFDAHYSPAYCEDSDLAFRIRQAGFETWLQPHSRVIHYEGKTSGTDTTRGVKAYQLANSRKLLERWQDTLAAHRINGDQPWLEKDRTSSGRVLVLDESIPTPDQDAGSVTTVKVIQVFQALGYKVVFAPTDNFLYQHKYTGDLQRIGVECLYAPFNVDLASHLREHGPSYDIVHIFRHGVMRKTIDLVRALCPQAVVMFNNMDLHYLRMQRQAQLEGHADDEAMAMKALELEIMAQADTIFVPSTHEQELLGHEGLQCPVRVMPFMVDEVAPVTPVADASDVMFLGGFQHPPNIDAVLWFHAEIWPLIAAACPTSRFVIAGAHPPPDIVALQSERVVVTGRLDDLRPAFESARVFVAPVRYGAGVKGKIYTAMSFGTPVVTTSVGAEGMGLQATVDALIADTPQEIAAAVVQVFQDSRVEQKLRAAGALFIAENATLLAGVRAMTAALPPA